jgi:hypothetical protein
LLEKIFRYKRIWLLLLAPLGFLLTLMAKVDASWVNGFYARYLYPVFANALGWLFSLAPFSVLEILMVLAGAGLLFYLGWSIFKMVKNRAAWKDRLWRLLLNLMGGASVIYFGFVLFMGLNYYRTPIAEQMDLSLRNSSKQELYSLCELLVYDCNFYSKQLARDASGVMVSEGDFSSAAAEAQRAYAALEKEVPSLALADIRNKPLLSSKLFSRVLTTGIYLPFESGINTDAPQVSLPATMCHELSHYRGVMRENEANFLGYLACRKADSAEFRYSGSLMAFEYAFAALYAEDRELAQDIAALCSKEMLADIAAEDAYWNQFRGTAVGNASQEVYEDYLQANGQQSGLKSYGEMVDLLLAYYRDELTNLR